MKILWIGLNFIGLGLIVYGAMAHYYGANTSLLVFTGMLCMAGSMMARRRVFRKR